MKPIPASSTIALTLSRREPESLTLSALPDDFAPDPLGYRPNQPESLRRNATQVMVSPA